MAIHVGATFATWQDFKSALQDYSRETFTVWTIWSNRTVAAANKRLKQGLDPEVDDGNPTGQLKFAPVSRRCIYSN